MHIPFTINFTFNVYIIKIYAYLNYNEISIRLSHGLQTIFSHANIITLTLSMSKLAQLIHHLEEECVKLYALVSPQKINKK